jgi:DNA-binding CsgD family transcriptional regulator
MATESPSLAFIRADGDLTARRQEPERISRIDRLPVRIPTDELRDPAFALRLGPPNAKYIASLMCLNGNWPPIVASRRGNTVIDGRHRLIAARRLGHTTIEVVFFDGPDEDAFLEAVLLNVRQGLPLTLRERECAALRVLESHGDWSDRRIAEICALSPGTVKVLRGPSTRPSADSHQLDVRTGRDGRSRPVDPGNTRLRIREVLRTRPDASLRELARAAACSPETVRAVRSSLLATEESNGQWSSLSVGSAISYGNGTLAVEQLPADAALTASEDGATFVAWFAQTNISDDDVCKHLFAIPLSRVYEIADEAQRRAKVWTAFARKLEARTRSPHARV